MRLRKTESKKVHACEGTISTRETHLVNSSSSIGSVTSSARCFKYKFDVCVHTTRTSRVAQGHSKATRLQVYLVWGSHEDTQQCRRRSPDGHQMRCPAPRTSFLIPFGAPPWFAHGKQTTPCSAVNKTSKVTHSDDARAHARTHTHTYTHKELFRSNLMANMRTK